MTEPKVKISILHEIDHRLDAFVRDSKIPYGTFDDRHWWQRLSPDGWLVLLGLVCFLVALLLVERPL